jgi:hypothetical protein
MLSSCRSTSCLTSKLNTALVPLCNVQPSLMGQMLHHCLSQMHHAFNVDQSLLTLTGGRDEWHTEAMFKSIMRSTWPDKVRSTQLFDVSQALELPPSNLFQLDEKVLPGDSSLENIRINKLTEKVVHLDCRHWSSVRIRSATLHSRTQIMDGVLDSASV